MLHEPEFKPTPREEEILARCVDYDRFREEIDDLKAEVKELREEVERLKGETTGAGTSVLPTTTVGRKSRKGKKAKPQAANTDLESLKAKFPSELAELLTFKVEELFLVLRPRKFLGSENFAKIAGVVREFGGKYLSAGKDSHFRVPVGFSKA